ncbi:MAG: GNAT family N-acetyltransferase [Caldilineaceae bacterium]|nr:GNAT family N-acetyltransferase [Caldilineaceae bacterium]
MTFDPPPVGEIVPPLETVEGPTRYPSAGHYVALTPLDADAHAEALFAASHRDEEKLRLWTYMTAGPFADVAAMRDWLRGCERSTDPLFFTVIDLSSNQPVGMVSYMNILPAMRRLELGNIWYTPGAQNTKVNTETIYLMLCETFDRLQYRRAEWKCDALNARSRAAAQRLGFSFEGIFRQHMIVRGRNRDTAWFAMIREDWPMIKTNMQRWLYGADESLSLRALNAPLLRPIPA